MRLWRIGSAVFPVWSAEGARLHGGRWNRPGTPAIYAATSYASAVLELLVHANMGRVPNGFHHISIDIPTFAKIETLETHELPDWDTMPPGESLSFGDAWLRTNRALVLLVPSVVTGGMDANAIINPRHPDFRHIAVSEEAPVRWDTRLSPSRTDR